MKFNNEVAGFDRDNALFLAHCSKIAYSSDYNQLHLLSDFAGINYFDKEGTQAFIAYDNEKIIVAFRGTEPNKLEDWITDMKVRKTAGPYGDVHRGFYQALNYVWPEMEECIEDICNDGKRRKVYFTGHSLGAALATLAAAKLQLCRHNEFDMDVDGLYTFGSPRVGSHRFAINFNKDLKDVTFRIVNNHDVVTRVPTSFTYGHLGNLIYFDDDGKIKFDRDLTWWGSFWDRQEERLGDIIEGNVIFDDISDHKTDEYIENLQKGT